MIEWISANIGTIIVGIIIAVIVAAVIVKLHRDKKRGISSCGCDCASCAFHGQCRKG